jgi:hypothetical protein
MAVDNAYEGTYNESISKEDLKYF